MKERTDPAAVGPGRRVFLGGWGGWNRMHHIATERDLKCVIQQHHLKGRKTGPGMKGDSPSSLAAKLYPPHSQSLLNLA